VRAAVGATASVVVVEVEEVVVGAERTDLSRRDARRRKLVERVGFFLPFNARCLS
jgi:hypothetical protein